VNSFGLNIYDLLYHDQLVLSRSAANELEELLGGKTSEDAGEAESGEEAPVKRKRTRKTEQEAA
jgi:ribosomal protein L4